MKSYQIIRTKFTDDIIAKQEEPLEILATYSSILDAHSFYLNYLIGKRYVPVTIVNICNDILSYTIYLEGEDSLYMINIRVIKDEKTD